MASNEDNFLSPPKPSGGYQRMISWELSQVQDYLTEATKPQKKNKKRTPSKRTPSKSTDENELDFETINLVGGEEGVAGYLVTNSDGEEELYYSAPQSPLISDDDDDAVTIVSESSLNQFDSSLISSQKKCSKSSRKKKKDRRKIQRMLRSDFFQPLCDLIDDTVTIDVKDMELTNMSTVLSLSEICLRTIKKMPLDQMEMQLPFLITTLVGHNKQISGIVSSHVQWLEKLLADVEKALLAREASNKKSNHAQEPKELKCIYILLKPWNTEFRPISANDFSFEGYHCPLPWIRHESNFLTYDYYLDDGGLFSFLLYYANYFYPVNLNDHISRRSSVSSGSSDAALEQVQRVAIDRVNNWIKTRYSKISLVYSKFFKLWPAYVHWARGNFHLAANDFASALPSFEGVEKAAILNEMGRMFIHSGDRHLASATFTKSNEVDLPLKDMDFRYQPSLIKACYNALRAGVWDTGLLDNESAGKAKGSWGWFLKDSSDISTNIWFLHVAAVESRLRVHAGRYVPDSVPQVNTKPVSNSVVRQWLDDCENLIKSENLLVLYPVLYYHLSLVYALNGNTHDSRKAFDAFNSNFAGFHDWGIAGLPGRVSEPTDLILHQYEHPWKNLFILLEGHSVSPILPLHWRVQLLHPLHPYSRTNDVADHTSTWDVLNLRLTSDGDLTGDMLMDLPPTRAVLINPYNGDILFKRVQSLQHYSIDDYNYQKTPPYIPYPLRLYESSHCVVELSLSRKSDIINPGDPVVNYMTVLHWYGTDGSHHKVDLRKLIRKKYKQEILNAIKDRTDLKSTPEAIEQYLDKIFEMGLWLSTDDILYNPPKVLSSSKQFQLDLHSSLVFGKGTILLAFKISSNHLDVLVFVDCTSVETFLNLKIYTASDGFDHLMPNPKPADSIVLKFNRRHLPHLTCIVATKVIKFMRYPNRVDKRYGYMVFNEEGNMVLCEEKGNDFFTDDNILGERLFLLSSESDSVISRNAKNFNKSHRSYRVFEPTGTILPVPGLVLVPCSAGLLVLHPGTLARVNIEGLRDSDGVDPPQDGFIYPQLSAITGRVDVLDIFDIAPIERDSADNVIDNTEKNEGEEDEEDDHLLPDDVTDYGSSRVSLAINDRIVILYCSPRTTQVKIEFDVSVPGIPKDFHRIAGLGYLVCVSQFPDSFRMELYLLSLNGSLLGILPCLGRAPHSFFSVSLPPSRADPLDKGSEEVYPGGVHVYFNDGLGGICCLRPQDVLL